jgi:hypothetical protein
VVVHVYVFACLFVSLYVIDVHIEVLVRMCVCVRVRACVWKGVRAYQCVSISAYLTM